MKSHTTNSPSELFMFCLNGACPRREECLRAQAVEGVEERESFRVLNPARYPAADAECAYFKLPSVQRLGWGVNTLLGSLPQNQSQRVRTALKEHYAHATFYRMLNGEVPFRPADQQFVADTLRSLGITDDPVFDRYTEVMVWE